MFLIRRFEAHRSKDLLISNANLRVSRKRACFVSVVSFVASVVCASLASPSLAAEVTSELPSPGLDALPTPSSFVQVSGEGGLEDGKIDTKSTGSIQTDQKYVGALNVAASYLFVPQFFLRLKTRTKYIDRLIQDQSDSSTQTTAKYLHVTGNLSANLATANGFEVFAGAKTAIQPKFTRTKKLPSLVSTTTYSSSTLYSPFAGLIKRAGPWTAGLVYEIGAEKTRHLVRTTQNFRDESDQYQTLPSTLGGMARFGLGANFEMNLELALVMLGDSEEKSSGANDSLNKDYYRAHLSALYPISSALNVYVGFTHRTLSYADQALMSLENIPETATELRLESVSGKMKLLLALVFQFAEDSQSLPELNASYNNRAVALKAGVVLPI